MKKLFREVLNIKESQCTIIADTQKGIQTAVESIRLNRLLLEEFGKLHPKFLWTLEPFPIPERPLVARFMAEAAATAGVGPMAAVAGVLADLAVKDMISQDCKVAVVEDGGEISALSVEPIDVAFAASDDPLSRRFGFRLTEFPAGVATSSGRFSHAISFGDAEAATIFCKEAGLADAAATAVGNVVKGERNKAIKLAIETAKSIRGVQGATVLYKGSVGTWGKIPEIIRVNIS